jgi:hypothetical protein
VNDLYFLKSYNNKAFQLAEKEFLESRKLRRKKFQIYNGEYARGALLLSGKVLRHFCENILGFFFLFFCEWTSQ